MPGRCCLARRMMVVAALALLGAAPWAAASPRGARAPSGVYYEIFVRSFYDSNGDGIGDLNGIAAKLDYLHWLGVSGIWLTPINPSPSYHGYDVTNYFAVNPQFGTLTDLRHLLRQAHARGIKVILDLVVNHTSDRNPWFQHAAAPGSPYHRWYIWSGAHTDLAAPSIFGTDPWHALAGGHYLGLFSADMPDLNYGDPAVRREVMRIGRFWLHQGVDGFRLDAAKHLYVKFASDRHDPRALARNIDWWRQFHAAMSRVDPRVFLVGEVSAGRESGEAPYYAALNCVFDFPLARTLIHSAATESAADVARYLRKTLRSFERAGGAPHMDCPFLSNHDQARVLDQLHGNPEHMRMAAAMLLTLPGRPFVYYGEELGMHGVKPDPGIREPMRWDRGMSAPGETTWESEPDNAQADLSVAAERPNPRSLLNFYRRLIHWRSALPALRDGALAPYPSSAAILAFIRADTRQRLLVVHNLSGRPRHLMLTDAGFRAVIRRTRAGVSLSGRRLLMPAYSSAILQ